MKRYLSVLVLAFFAASTPLVAQSTPELKFDANAAIVSLPEIGEVAGVATNSHGQVFVYVRTGQPVATTAPAFGANCGGSDTTWSFGPGGATTLNRNG